MKLIQNIVESKEKIYSFIYVSADVNHQSKFNVDNEEKNEVNFLSLIR